MKYRCIIALLWEGRGRGHLLQTRPCSDARKEVPVIEAEVPDVDGIEQEQCANYLPRNFNSDRSIIPLQRICACCDE
jgi:hypothetical protein